MTVHAWRGGKPLFLSRRGFVHGSLAGFGGAAALSLVGCGDDDDATGSSGQSAASPAVSASPAQSPAAAKPVKGGKWKGAIESGPTSLDPFAGSSFTTSLYGSYTYSRLLRNKTGPGVDPYGFEVEFDVAQSIERVDELTYVVKLRPTAKFHPPISRAVVGEDVAFSYKRTLESAIGLQANITDSVTAIDASTVKFKLKRPDAEYLGISKSFFIQPVEAGTAFDPTKKMVGTGPWIFEEYRTDNLLRYRRNPEWHLGPDAPYMDNVELSVVPEYATRLSQFLGGNIDHLELQGNDVPRATKELKDLQIYRGQLGLAWNYISFAGNPEDGKAPWRDPRVRRAVSMALDRDGMTEAAYNVSQLKSALPGFELRWNNIVPASTRPFWLDPKGGAKFKPNDPTISALGASSFKYDPKAAKDLLAAAGFPDGIDVDGAFHYPIARYGEPFRIISELTVQFLAKIGFKIAAAPEDYQAVFAPTSLLGNYKGLLHVAGGGGYPLANSITIYYIPGAIRNNARVDDPKLSAMVTDATGTFDPEQRRIKILQIQQYTSEQMYYVPGQLGAVGSFLAYPSYVGGALDYQTSQFDQGNETMPFLWKKG